MKSKNNSKIKVTVGISAFNEEKNIYNLIKSILNQKKINHVLEEIIVISDGSTDKTCIEIRKIKSEKVKLISEDKRKGQNYRQNQIIKMMSKNSDCLLRFEADTLPSNNDFIDSLVTSIPKTGYSIISCNSKPTYNDNLFSKIILSGYNLKNDIFRNALPWPNLYLFEVTLLSREFLKTFKWKNEFHEDSYCYRKAYESGMPIIINFKAESNFKLVDNLHDYLIQSSKFQKAKDKESAASNIYSAKFNYFKAGTIFLNHFFKNPIFISFYLSLYIVSRLYSKRLPKYNILWPIYKSTKSI